MIWMIAMTVVTTIQKMILTMETTGSHSDDSSEEGCGDSDVLSISPIERQLKKTSNKRKKLTPTTSHADS
jgi:hypothetical protein